MKDASQSSRHPSRFIQKCGHQLATLKHGLGFAQLSSQRSVFLLKVIEALTFLAPLFCLAISDRRLIIYRIGTAACCRQYTTLAQGRL